MRTLLLIVSLLAVIGSFGCSLVSSPVLGGTVGAAAGAAAGRGNPLVAAAGAAIGAGAGAVLGNSVKTAYQRGLDDGYLQGSSDAVKRLYWDKQRLEGHALSSSSAEALLAAQPPPSDGLPR